MNPFLESVIATLIRQLLILLASAVGMTPLLDQYMTDVQKFSSSAALVLITVGYAIWRKYKDRQKLVTALAAEGPVTEHEVEAMVKDHTMPTPSVKTAKDVVPF